MGYFIFVVVILFFGSALIAAIINGKKQKEYENDLPESAVKNQKLYKGSMTMYVVEEENKTILRYFVSRKTNILADFIPHDEISVKNCLVLFDKERKKIAIVKDIRNHGTIITINFSDVISLQPVEISKRKKVTRGGISPISIAGYRWASTSTRMLKEVARVYIELKYKKYDKEFVYEIDVFDGLTYEDRDSYEKIVDKVNSVINKLHDIIAG